MGNSSAKPHTINRRADGNLSNPKERAPVRQGGAIKNKVSKMLYLIIIVLQ
jgi:hypothetical protein